MRTPVVWIGTGWKMNKTLAEALAYAERLQQVDGAGLDCIQRFIVPSFPVLREVKAALRDSGVLVGAQTMHWAESGPFTGEVSAPMLVDCGVDLVELGHSERRAQFGETDDAVGRKVATAMRHGLIPLICVGETREDRDAGRAAQVLQQQVRGALERLDVTVGPGEVLFAYEPVWAIGAAGTAAEPAYAAARQAEIKALAADLLGQAPPCLYGGSVTEVNCDVLIAEDSIDGLFIGRAAWDVAGYLRILQRCAERIKGG